MRSARNVARTGETRNAYKVVVGKPEGKRPLGRPSRRWKYNVKMDLREIWWDVVGWMHLTWDRKHWRTLVSTVMKLQDQ
jgi:hypothetical protein